MIFFVVAVARPSLGAEASATTTSTSHHHSETNEIEAPLLLRGSNAPKHNSQNVSSRHLKGNSSKSTSSNDVVGTTTLSEESCTYQADYFMCDMDHIAICYQNNDHLHNKCVPKDHKHIYGKVPGIDYYKDKYPLLNCGCCDATITRSIVDKDGTTIMDPPISYPKGYSKDRYCDNITPGPSVSPSTSPSVAPTTSFPSTLPSSVPTAAPTTGPTTTAPTTLPTEGPTTSRTPTVSPTTGPTVSPTICTEEICQNDCYDNKECPSSYDCSIGCGYFASTKVNYYNECLDTMDVEGSTTPPCTDDEGLDECCEDKAQVISDEQAIACKEECATKCRGECATICTGFCADT